ncbi:xanthine dehydrogenase family protein subunit M [Pedobacter sp. HMF7647]|uniref:Xanthine dehydrogenase family protein subunit M n=1 Tax=Hufsiella arboris TaxID=2695275 RepID=A0A7K1Y7Z4_9SPHI|nr:xanthine dehydrogenase family protein subunit M [Hufsiella arboris]MXV50714.1 xanthine dehydrogenase family protein subunit M [Hufsiella arboris]
MNRFTFNKAGNIADAFSSQQQSDFSKFIAGGTNLLDLMKENVERPDHLTDINALPFQEIGMNEDGGLRLGALVTNADTAYHPEVEKRYPLISHAILAGASPQLRNKATNGGNLLQRTRCYYFYDTALPCNKRKPGSGCGALQGFNRIHAIFGTSDHCIATHPSDFCVALAALGARVNVTGPSGERTIEFEDFHRLPEDTPEKDTNLHPGELVTSIDLPEYGFHENYKYLKIRDRASYAFALVSVAAGLKINDGKIEDVRIALGGVAHKPWRNKEAENMLKGTTPEKSAFEQAADLILKDARGFGHNDFKIILAKRAIVKTLSEALNS